MEGPEIDQEEAVAAEFDAAAESEAEACLDRNLPYHHGVGR